MTKDSDTRASPDWLRPATDQGGLSYYVDVLRERIWIVIAVVLVTVGAAGAYLFTAEDVYEGEARLLITPAPADDAIAASLGLPRDSNDPTRDVETLATLATSLEVAERAKEELDLDESARSLRSGVSAEPVASSNLISVTAEAATPAGAADLANAFATGLVEDRTEAMHDEVDRLLPQYQQQLDSSSGTDVTSDASLESDVARLEALQTGSDPTVRLETRAVAPVSPVSPRPMLTMIGALLAGIVLGIAGAFATQTLDPRLRREQQLRSRYQLPILARVPREPGGKRPLGPGQISLPAKEAYRTLRANIAAGRRDPRAPHSVLVTGSSPSEGKTTTAINLAGSLALAGNRVILIEADLRRPAIAQTLGIQVETGVVSVMLENTKIEDALITTPAFGPSLQLLLADYKGGWMSELFSLHAAQRLLAAAKARADYVIVDSPPLTTVVDTLPLARQADDVLIVARLGVTRNDKLPELAELLASNGITPLGFALIGTDRTESYYYHEEDEEPRPDHLSADAPVEDAETPEPAGRGPATNGPEPATRPGTAEGEVEPEGSAQSTRWSWGRSSSGSG